MSQTAAGIFLLEIGCEEIPDRMVEGARRDLAEAVRRVLVEGRLLTGGESETTGSGSLESFATMRRLAVRVRGLPARQPDETVEVTGPPLGAAYDPQGRPTRAALGFAAGQGVAVGELYSVKGAKGEVVAARRVNRGSPTADMLARVVPPAVLSLSFPKSMAWGDGSVQFVRPIRWVVALLDGEIVPMSIAGVAADRITSPRRGSGRPAITIREPGDYESALRDGEVLAHVGERRAAIRESVQQAAREAGGSVVPDPELEEIVLNLVEYPGILAGRFPEEFLELPDEVLTTTLRHHQRCFSVAGAQGRLRPCFVGVVNVPGDPDGDIRAGYERVIAGRLADARFFYREDRREPLEGRLAALERTRFHADLGSYAAKVGRVERLGSCLSELTGQERVVAERLRRAARLSKCDLATQMENEFPELQGVVGGLYAREEGAPEPVWRAVYDQYRPEGLDDRLPRDPEGALLSLADRLDNLVGLMGVGVVPKGSRDPFALRRAALGVVRLLVEWPLHLSFRQAVQAARDAYEAGGVQLKEDGERLHGLVSEFVEGRLRYLFESAEAGYRYDSISAVLAAGWDDPADAAARLAALTALRGQEDFEAIAAASKRIRNILTQADSLHGTLGELAVDPARFQEPAEGALHEAAARAARSVEKAAARKDHAGALASVAALRPEVDGFFDTVLVMAENADIRRNRLALLASVARLYAKEADFAEIVVEGNP
jgi:glycyl-tRNA synthetase beta chain